MDSNNSSHFFKEAIGRNIDFIIKTLTIGGTILAMASVILYLRTDISNEITKKFNDKDVIEKIAKEIKPPFIIFDANGKVLHNDDCENYIMFDKIIVKYDRYRGSSIIISTKKFLKIPPIISSIDAEMFFQDAKRIEAYKWQYDAKAFDVLVGAGGPTQDKMPANRFRLEIIR